MVAIDNLPSRSYDTTAEQGLCLYSLQPVVVQDAPRISVNGKNLVVDGIAVPEAEYSNTGKCITFRQEVPGIFRSGTIYFDESADKISGHISAGPSHAEARMTTFTGIIRPSIYNTKLTENGAESNGPDVVIGYEKVKEDGKEKLKPVFKVGVYNCPDQLKIEPCGMNMVYEQEESGTTAMVAMMSMGAFPVSFKISISWDSTTFDGTFDKMIGTNPDGSPQTTTLVWKGKRAPSAAPAPPVFLNAASAGPPGYSYSATRPLSVADLWSLSVEPEGVQEKSQNLLIRNMKYTMDATQREELLGVTRPQVGKGDPGSRALDFESSKQFYGTDFFYGYIGTAYKNSPPSDRHKISDDDGWKLRYYMQKGLAELPAYSEHTQALYLDAYLLREKRIQDYIDDQNKREDKEYWAKELFKVITSDAQLNIIVYNYLNEVGHPFDLYKIRGTVLSLLQPSGVLAAESQEALYGALLQVYTNKVDLDTELSKEWLGDAIGRFIEDFIDNPDISDATDQEKLDLMEAARTAKELSHKLGGNVALGQALYNVIHETAVWPEFELPAKVNMWSEAFKTKHPKITKGLKQFKSMFLGLAYIGAVSSLAMAIFGWDSLDAVQKAQLLVDSVAMSGRMLIKAGAFGAWAIDKVVDMSKYFSKITMKGTNALLGVYRRLFKAGSYDLAPKVASKLSRYFSKLAKKIVVEIGEAIGKLLKNAAKALKYLGPVLSLAAAGFSAYNLYKAIAEGGSAAEIAMHALITVAAIMETVFLVVEIAFSFSWAGPAGLVCAVIGAIAALVLMFLPREPPLSPAEKFILNDLPPFLKDKKEPDADWKTEWGENNKD